MEYIPRYQHMPWWKETEMYNDLSKKMQVAYTRWYGSAFSLSSSIVASLLEKIKRGETTFTAWKREFDDENYKAISGHTLTEEKSKMKDFIKNYYVITLPIVKDSEGNNGFLWEAFLYKNSSNKEIVRSHKLFTSRKQAEKYFDKYWIKF